ALAQGLLQTAGGGQGSPLVVVDDLGVNVLGGAEDRQPRPPGAQLPEAEAYAPAAPLEQVFCRAHGFTSSSLPCAGSARRRRPRPCPYTAPAAARHAAPQRPDPPAACRSPKP